VRVVHYELSNDGLSNDKTRPQWFFGPNGFSRGEDSGFQCNVAPERLPTEFSTMVAPSGLSRSWKGYRGCQAVSTNCASVVFIK
jgi:hypothetical protein